MGRPVKWRRVNQMPTVLQFLPSEQTDAAATDNILLIEEYEAIRLKDLEGLEQEACAEQMQISRPTFQRILTTARQKVADSLIHGKGIRITGGNFTRNICPVHCLDCGLSWEESLETLTRERTGYQCPSCNSVRVICAANDTGMQSRGRRNRFCQRGCGRGAQGAAINDQESERMPDAENNHSD